MATVDLRMFGNKEWGKPQLMRPDLAKFRHLVKIIKNSTK
jgi:hypothetical protein